MAAKRKITTSAKPRTTKPRPARKGKKQPDGEGSLKQFFDRMIERAERIPEEELRLVPRDGSMNLDFYEHARIRAKWKDEQTDSTELPHTLNILNQLVSSDPNILGGLPVFAGTDVAVNTLFEYLERDRTLTDFLQAFPTVPREIAYGVLEQVRLRFNLKP